MRLFCVPALWAIALTASPVLADSLLLPPGATWKYLDNGSNQGVSWRSTNFNDSAWPSGRAELGYGDSVDGRPEQTQLGYGTNASAKFITSYFRRWFDAPGSGAFTNLLLGVMRDDGAVVYLNGSEVWRNNMPATTVSYTTTAVTNVNGPDEAAYFRANLNPALLRPGSNLLAVEIHQASASSSDVSFDLFLLGQSIEPAPSSLRFYVATNGDDDWSGTAEVPSGTAGPFATLERGRDAVRFYVQNNFMPTGGVVVSIGPGTYFLQRQVNFAQNDSGTAQSQVTYQGAGDNLTRISGGRMVRDFTLVTDPSVLGRLDPSARGRVWQADLRAQGITNFGPVRAGSTWAQSDPGLEVFFRDQPMTVARWPNQGYIRMAAVLGPTPVDVRGTVGCVEGIFSADTDRLARWAGEPDVMLHGFWFWDWADQRQRVLSIDPSNRVVTLAQPYHTYGYRKGQWFYAYNLLPEIDQPGEWYLDRSSGVLYLWPPGPVEAPEVMVSALPSLVTLTNVSHVTFQHLVLEAAQQYGLTVSGGASNAVLACTIRNLGKTAVRIVNSPGSGISGCEIHSTGDGAISLSAGDRRTLTPGGLWADDNHIHHWSRWNPVYHPGISLGGVGQRVSHNLIHDAPHEAIGFGGNDHLIEFNDIHNVVKESNDAGVIYAGRTWSARGHIIRYNYIHHIYGFERRGCNGVYLDDQFSSALVYGNLFDVMPTAILIGGGRDNFVLNNTFVNCRRSISIDARGLGWASNAVQTLTNDLNSLPYQVPPWSARYPELTNILNEEPMAPKGNVVARNICWSSGWTSIETKAQPGVAVSNNLVGIDPLFVDTNRHDFQLRDDSPAFSLGFERLPLESVGPRTNVEHAPWPPSTTLIEPAPAATLVAPADVHLEAVLSDPDRIQTAVEFRLGNAALATVADRPFAFKWTNAPPGSYLVGSRAAVSGLDPFADWISISIAVPLVAPGSVWKYLDNGSNQGTAWRNAIFNDLAWPSGPAELGYGDAADGRPESTTISFGPSSTSKYITTYFRRSFTVVDPSRFTDLRLGLVRDDGAVVYLNGQEVFRSNMTNGPITYLTPVLVAVGGNDEAAFYTASIPASSLLPGTNLLAVEVHQVNGTSSDLSFDLSLNAPVIPGPPALQARRQGPEIVLSWDLGAADWLLQTTPSLTSAPWAGVPSSPRVDGAQVTTSLPIDQPAAFFKLVAPQGSSEP